MAPRKQKVTVSERAILARINRKLAKDNEVVKKARTMRTQNDMGDFYRLDLHRNCVIGHDVDLADLAAEIGVLRPWEQVVAG